MCYDAPMKDHRLALRIEGSLKKRLDVVSHLTGLKMSVIIMAVIDAICQYVETHGTITFPLEIKPKEPKP